MKRASWNGVVIAESDDIVTVEGNAYFPESALKREYFKPSETHTSCAWKGTASYYSLEVDGQRNDDAAWYYPQPTRDFAVIKDYVAFYAGRMDACYVDDEVVRPQGGGFYGGWITSDVVGPFKGDTPDSWGW